MTRAGKRALGRLMGLRQQQRDRAAALLAAAELARDAAARDLVSEGDALDALDAALPARLAQDAARTLDLFAAERARAHAAIAAAREATRGREAAAARAREAVAQGERDLRVAETHLERWQAEQLLGVARAEQRQTDELAARRPGRRT